MFALHMEIPIYNAYINMSYILIQHKHVYAVQCTCKHGVKCLNIYNFGHVHIIYKGWLDVVHSLDIHDGGCITGRERSSPVGQ